jgi:ABC-2 type transport system ATP-binding protein
MAGTTIIRTEHLGRDFVKKRALDSIDLVLEAGAPIGLVGPNGAGKTTFFSVLCGFLRLTRGTVEVLGRPPLHRDLHGRVAILPQDAQFVKGVPVLKQLAMLAELQGFSAKAARDEAARVLQLVLLADAAKKTPDMLSHGMLKRIAIAQAFLGAPELVLLDEPTAGLDPATASEMKNLIRSLDKERTFVISSHNLQDIEELCGTVVILDRGKIVEHRKVSELVGRTNCLTFRLEADPPQSIVAPLTAVAQVTRVELGRPGERRLAVHFRDDGEGGNRTQIAVLQALTAAGIGMIEMTRGQSLQDKVIEMTRPASSSEP